MSDQKYKNFKEFYPFYLSEHSNKTCRILHVIGSSLVIAVLIFTIAIQQYKLLLLLPVIGYGFAWVGHYVFEKNTPATFKYPLYSFIGDWVMWWQFITLKLK
ncbi:MAG: DUF962 domain-containing protein [Alcanivoracaceae bacterium]|nr:DUF962 domain-containing protein [Alcanivoracaceae bacterium]